MTPRIEATTFFHSAALGLGILGSPVIGGNRTARVLPLESRGRSPPRRQSRGKRECPWGKSPWGKRGRPRSQRTARLITIGSSMLRPCGGSSSICCGMESNEAPNRPSIVEGHPRIVRMPGDCRGIPALGSALSLASGSMFPIVRTYRDAGSAHIVDTTENADQRRGFAPRPSAHLRAGSGAQRQPAAAHTRL